MQMIGNCMDRVNKTFPKHLGQIFQGNFPTWKYLGGGQNLLERPNVEDRYFGGCKFRILKEQKMSYSIFFIFEFFLFQLF